MKQGMDKLKRIQALMEELQSELASLPQFEEKLKADNQELDKETLDILHIVESVEMTPTQKTLVFDRTAALRHERREVKNTLKVVVPMNKATRELYPHLEKATKDISNTLAHAKEGRNYSMRSQKGAELLERIIPEYANHTDICFIPKNGVSAPKSAVPKPVSTPPKKESTISYRVVRSNNNRWALQGNACVVLETPKLTEIIEYLYTNGWQSVATDEKSRRHLKADLRAIKKGEVETARIVHCSRLQQSLF